MSLKFFLIVTGPHPYLKEGPKIEEYIITQEEIEENREGDEPDSEIIQYLLDEAVAEWEQRLCKAIVLDEASFLALKKSGPDFQV